MVRDARLGGDRDVDDFKYKERTNTTLLKSKLLDCRSLVVMQTSSQRFAIPSNC
jgi:hypothetical protein